MKTNINKKAVGSRIKQIRINKGYTLESFGKLFGASKGNVQQWENGISLPNKERLATISKIADMTVNELLYGSVDEFAKENYEKIIIDTYGNKNGIPIASTINKADFSKFIKDKKLDNNLLNDIDNLTDIIWNLTNEYIINSKQYRLEYNNEIYFISENLHKIISTYEVIYALQEKYKNNKTIENALNTLDDVINLMLHDTEESAKVNYVQNNQQYR